CAAAASRPRRYTAIFRGKDGRLRRELAGAIPQHVFLDLARDGLRQRTEHDMLRNLEMREVLAAPRDDIARLRALRIILERDEGAGRFAPVRIGPSDDRSLHHVRMTIKALLDFERAHVLAARDDDVLQ